MCMLTHSHTHTHTLSLSGKALSLHDQIGHHQMVECVLSVKGTSRSVCVCGKEQDLSLAVYDTVVQNTQGLCKVAQTRAHKHTHTHTHKHTHTHTHTHTHQAAPGLPSASGSWQLVCCWLLCRSFPSRCPRLPASPGPWLLGYHGGLVEDTHTHHT